MRTLSWADVEDILLGATICGCGGGGELEEGRELLHTVYDAGRSVTLVAPDELAADALVACPYAVGAMTLGDEQVYEGRPFSADHPSVLAVRALEEHVGQTVAALLTGELGGTSIADAFYPAAMLDLPIVDADPVGRAVPEIEHSLFFVNSVPIAPQAVVNEIGDTVIVTQVADDRRAEALVRALSVASRNAVWVADHAQPWSRLRDCAVLGAISGALAVGRAARRARAAGADAALAVAEAAGGRVLFRGQTASHDWRDAEGFTVGETTLTGGGEFAGSSYRIWFKNENLMAWRDGEPDVTCPDLICLLDAASGLPLTNPNVPVGVAATVVGLPAAAQWHTPEGVATLGPAHFGFGVAFRPVETAAAAGRSTR
jgi:hypothetical protein